MGCLTHKESKKNAILDVEKNNFFVVEGDKTNTRQIDLSKQSEFKAYHDRVLKATNENYGLKLTSLFETELKVYNEEVD